MEQRIQFMPLDIHDTLQELFDDQIDEITEVLSGLSQDEQREYVEMLKVEIQRSRKKIEANFIPDKIRRVFDIVIKWRGVQRKVLLDFLMHIHKTLAFQGDLTPEAVIGYLNENRDVAFPLVGERLLCKIKDACREDVVSR